MWSTGLMPHVEYRTDAPCEEYRTDAPCGHRSWSCVLNVKHVAHVMSVVLGMHVVHVVSYVVTSCDVM